MSATVVRASAAHLRIERARAWLSAREPSEEVLVVAANADAASDLLRDAAAERGAAFGWHRATLGRVAMELSTRAVVERGLASVSALASEAVVAQSVQTATADGKLGRFAAISEGPGFARAIAQTLSELRLSGVEPAALEKTAPELRAVYEIYLAHLSAERLVDRAGVFELATAAANDPECHHPWLGLPTLFLDIAVREARALELLGALAARAPDLFATVAAGDPAPIDSDAEDLDADARAQGPAAPALRRLQTNLFEGASPPRAEVDDNVKVLSAPGESRECVEIARQIQREAAAGTPFDRIAILLRAAIDYRPHLEEALARAGIPAHFARGAVRPDPAGRAFLALLACAGEDLSARRFAEYLSLGELPDAAPDGGPPREAAGVERWVAPDTELVPSVVAAGLDSAGVESHDVAAELGVGRRDPETVPVVAGALRAPRRWERLLVDAAVIGGRDRWQRRLAGLESELRTELSEQDDAKGANARRLERDLDALLGLRAYAMPILEVLDALPREANWREWLDALGALASRALRSPERVLSVLAELEPMGEVGPVGLAEIRQVLSRRLREVSIPSPSIRYGHVFVGPVESARGMGFDVAFVPGLAERLFPQKIREDPILLDHARGQLARDGHRLATNDDRVAEERRALRIAVGAATRRVVLSYPRLEIDQSRPRVPSFYALEALRAAEGRLPGFAELEQRAESASDARVGWPAPREPASAIDEAEHDLALLEQLMQLQPERSVGTARFLVTANPHLGRALRFRARRWLTNWTVADGLVRPSETARAAIAKHALNARSYSPTALQNYATCPYKFFLHAIHRLAPREVPEAIEELSPLQRGSLVHEVQFELFGRLRDEGLLPFEATNHDRIRDLIDETLDAVAAKYFDEFAPAIERVWTDGVDHVRADLREWLRESIEDESGFVPWRFEFSFGLPGRRERDPHSIPEPVELECGVRLRGSIDLVERRGREVRVTDHKTGKVRATKDSVIGGGESLQPVLYALAAERAFSDDEIRSGRLYYCTTAGGFAKREVDLNRTAREAAQQMADTVGAALAEPFLPAAPKEGACRFCDYRVVCGPYEELRTSRKWSPPIEPLTALRELP